MKYRKKPVIVEAEQWFPGKVVKGVTEQTWTPEGASESVSLGYGHVVTIHGQRTQVAFGDWVITEPDGMHHYPCKPDIFQTTYELVTE